MPVLEHPVERLQILRRGLRGLRRIGALVEYQSALSPFSSAVPRMNCHTPRALARDSADGLNALSISGM